MSSRHPVVSATHRSAGALAGAHTVPARQFQSEPIPVPHLLSQVRARLGGAWQVVCLWRRRHRDRAALRSLSVRDIRDFCPRETEAEEEMSKPFWRG